jgi:adenylate cyclase class IV
MGLKNIEIEFKFNADEISRKDFCNLIEKKFKPIKTLELQNPLDDDSGDHYYTKGDRFMRFRTDGKSYWELTTKVKQSETNNRVRVEVNIPLGKKMTLNKAEAFADVFGLKHDFTIKKDVAIYWIDHIVLSHYICYDPKGKKLNTFMEIEANEEHEFSTEQEALDLLVEWEKKLEPLGINANKRIKKSLFEFYTNEK